MYTIRRNGQRVAIDRQLEAQGPAKVEEYVTSRAGVRKTKPKPESKSETPRVAAGTSSAPKGEE